jgi:hypothetical protein
MTDVHKIHISEKNTPFEEAAKLAFRLSTSLIVSEACKQASQFEIDVEIGLDHLNLPPEVRLQVMMDYASLKDRWDLLLAAPLCVD